MVRNAPPLYVGQLNTPDSDRVTTAFDGILQRRYYTNHGPLVAELEARLAERLGVRNVICVTNGTVALMVAAKASNLSGKVILPAYTFPATAQALTFAGLEPVLADVDPRTHNLTAATVAPLIDADVSAIVGVHMWGRACDVDALAGIAGEHTLSLAFDAAHGFGCGYMDRSVGGFGRFETFSFHATKILNCAEGGCVSTNDDDLAQAIRTVANFHDRPGDVSVSLRINGKMSEAQAAMGLLSLEDFDANVAANRDRYLAYRAAIRDIDGLTFVDHASDGPSNYQYVVLEVEEHFGRSQEDLMRFLQERDVIARRYFYPGMHRVPPYDTTDWDVPETDRLCSRVLQLPSGDGIGGADIDRVVSILRDAKA